MNPTRSIAVRLLSTFVVAAGLVLAAAASACPDSNAGTACNSPSCVSETAAASSASSPAAASLMIPETTPVPELGTPAVAGLAPPAKSPEPDFGPLESVLNWLLSGAGTHGGQKVAADRAGTKGERKAAKDAAKLDHKRSSTNWRWSGYGGNIARPHRLPNPEIL